MNSDELPKRIRLMADYYCFPLWGDDGVYMGDIDPAMLPISKGLQKDLLEWAEWYDSILNKDDPGASDFPSPEDRKRFKAEGERLVNILNSELGGQFSVRLHRS